MAREIRQPKPRERRRHERVRVKLDAQVWVRSLGSPVAYEFMTSDISIGGVFLKGSGKNYPFKEQTLLEIYVLLREEPETVLNFMGRIVHNAGGGFGIKIVQIDDQAQQGLNDFIKDLVDSGAEIVGYPQDPDESDDDGNKGG